LTTRVQIPATAPTIQYSSSPSDIPLLGGNTAKRAGTYDYDKIFDQAIRRLNSSFDVSEQGKNCIGGLVEHLLVKDVSK
jgi:hypothetical protein